MEVKSVNSNTATLLQLKKKLNQNNESQKLLFKIYILCGTRDSRHLVEKEYVM